MILFFFAHSWAVDDHSKINELFCDFLDSEFSFDWSDFHIKLTKNGILRRSSKKIF